MRIRRLAPLFALLVATGRPATADEQRLTVLHTTDLHGALTAYDYLADRPAARGLTRIATLVQRVRDEGEPVLLLDAGDCIQGSPLEVVHRSTPEGRPEPMMAAMNRIGYDAMAVGNHEFDFGLAAVERARQDARFPWLAANILTAEGRSAFQATLVKQVGDVRVGVIGLCTPAVPSWLDSTSIGGLRFESPVAAARREVERLRTAERCDVIVVLAHTGLGRDPVTGAEPPGDLPDENWGHRIATEVQGVDVLVLGHTHVVVPSQEIGGTLVTQAGKWAEALGRVDVTLARAASGERWTVARTGAQIVAVSSATPEDSALVRLAAPYHDATQNALGERIAEATAELVSHPERLADGPLWDLVHAAQLEASGAEVSLAPLFDPSARIAAGSVTLRDALKLYPYENTLGVVELTGQELAETLEHAARYFAPYTYEADRPLVDSGRYGFNFDAAQGVSYEIDLTRPPGDRIINLHRGGQPLDPERTLKVAVSSYRMNGGGGFEAIRRAPRTWRSTEQVRDLLVAHVRRRGRLEPSTDHNWTLLPDYVAARERPLIDLLVRQGVAPKEEVHRLLPDEPARRGDLAYWLARAFGWRERKLSGAFADVPDSLEPWLDGLLRRKVLGPDGDSEHFRPFATAATITVLDWCERAARHESYALTTSFGDRSFRLGLLAGIGAPGAATTGAALYRDTLARAEVLGMVANARFPTVRVLGTTDFHGAILPGASERRTSREWGGSAVLASHLERLRAENPFGTVLVDSGDWYQGTMISNLQFGRPVIEQMNALGYAAAAIGNHEFDWTADTLVQRIAELRCRALGANLRERKSGRRPDWAGSDTSMVRRGVRVAIFGLCYPNTPSVTLPRYVAHLRFDDDSATAAERIPALRKQGAEVVIGIGHIPALTDSTRRVRGDLARLARGVRGVDAWLGGHSHNHVAGEVAGVPALIAGSHGQQIALCDLVVDPVRDRVVEHRFRLVATYADEVSPDSAMKVRIERWNAGVAPIASEPVGRNLRRLTRTRGGESTVGNLVTDAIRTAAGVEIALQNTGGLRADLAEGVVTKGAIYEVIPFENTIVTMELTGAEVRRALEEALQSERITQVSGIHYEFDLGRPGFQRVVRVTNPDGSPFDESRRYRVAVNNFMADGGDDSSVLTQGRDWKDTQVAVRDTLEAFVRTKSASGQALDYRLEGRIARFPGSRPHSRPD
ncbi:MAG TPA: 5'-nucleotidase C-terminal domain-containing protein [Candidatus Limnocylindria bacterium]|nr:5'-nucleotidase C-terminal domain-containing protein [Candidatus Limnocylindria bacterium]